MLKYIAKRVLLMIPVILGVSFIVFLIMSFTPGDPARLILGQGASFEEVANLREAMGLNDNILVRYFRYVKDAVFKFDLGNSYSTKLPVTIELFERFPSTLKLAFGSTLLMIFIGVPVGIISAVKQYSLIDRISLVTALLLTSMPAFWLGLMLILFFSLRLGWLPATGVDTIVHFILPCTTLAAAMMASLIRMTRSNMLEVIRQDYIRTARAKGAKEMTVIYKHALRNALLPVITIIGLNFGGLLGGTMIIESVFAMPGLGTLTINAIRMKDTPTVMASVLFVAIFAGIINLIVDILYVYVDPRIKSQYSKS
ncbi:ABC transporter permease [Alkaliphilus peptidifermentans]|uniref:Peptide/nickel transport system permease protein n=1 Tax=Alkaliphilus peptidifermentans DSM 18978 TaxID=1120976 RepID=A0A1G5E4U2_9FIRM|nr:ABC transporter permease [Alkaliphilus peptidifermentans]SCY21751.1 peptide/nickel transport system permease protein [Alkaliphilus peptidifermentans DSM 18978]